MAAGPSHFWGAKSNQNRLSPEMLLCAQCLCAVNRAKPGLQTIALSCRAGPWLGKICYALLSLMATIVLPDFGRSLSADFEKNHTNLLILKIVFRQFRPELIR